MSDFVELLKPVKISVLHGAGGPDIYTYSPYIPIVKKGRIKRKLAGICMTERCKEGRKIHILDSVHASVCGKISKNNKNNFKTKVNNRIITHNPEQLECPHCGIYLYWSYYYADRD